jgi:hypothetical protein
MRIYTIDVCAILGSKLEPADFVAAFLPIIEALQDDASWRVRQQLARDMHRVSCLTFIHFGYLSHIINMKWR